MHFPETEPHITPAILFEPLLKVKKGLPAPSGAAVMLEHGFHHYLWRRRALSRGGGVGEVQKTTRVRAIACAASSPAYHCIGPHCQRIQVCMRRCVSLQCWCTRHWGHSHRC